MFGCFEDDGKREGGKRWRGCVSGLLPAQFKAWKQMHSSYGPNSECRVYGRGEEAQHLFFREHAGGEVNFRKAQGAKSSVYRV